MADKPKGPKGGSSLFTPGGLHRLDVYLAPEIKERLREEAFRRRQSMSELAGQAIEAFLDRISRRRQPKK